MRREAIDLMFASPRQEGMWDGVLSARLGRWIVSCEEEGLPPPELPADRGKWFGSMGVGELQHSYPSPPHIVDEIISAGWGNGRRISEVVDDVVGRGANEFGSDGNPENSIGMRANITEAIPRTKWREGVGTEDTKGWTVPEKNRVQLTVVDFRKSSISRTTIFLLSMS